jgi:hypothetical protein
MVEHQAVEPGGGSAGALAQVAAKQKKGLLFVNKKKQKNFSSMGRGGALAPRPMEKVFWFFFSKKNRFLP